MIQANKSTRVLLIAARVIKLPSLCIAHPRNSSEQRVPPSCFYLAAWYMELGIKFCPVALLTEQPPSAVRQAVLASVM